MGAQFKSALDFAGFYQGSYDGRNAEIQITTAQDPDGTISLNINFIDRDRHEEYAQGFGGLDSGSHVLQDITLPRVGGTGNVNLQYLLLHTWNTDFLSGVSTWNSTPYGMSFTRR